MLVKIVLASMGVTFIALTSFGVQAMPMSYAPAQAAAYDVTKVAGGCGVGFYRGPLGGCVRAGERAVIAPRPAVVAPPADRRGSPPRCGRSSPDRSPATCRH